MGNGNKIELCDCVHIEVYMLALVLDGNKEYVTYHRCLASAKK